MTFALGIDCDGSSVKAVAVTSSVQSPGDKKVSFDGNEPFD